MIERTWDHHIDVLIVGSGNGAMTAALTCHELGIADVLTVEKADRFGGTSATSGGGIWIPCSRYAKAAGANDSLDDARTYLKHALRPGVVRQELIDTFLQCGPEMIDFLHDRTRVLYRTLEHYPDYYSDKPGAKAGHRSLEPAVIPHSELGEEAPKLRLVHQMMLLFNRLSITQVEAHVLTGKQKGWRTMLLRMLWRHFSDLPWLMRHKSSRRLTCGAAGVARLRLSMLERNMPLWLNTEFISLITDKNNAVIGAVVKKEGRDQRIRTTRGVILACGGFEHNQVMREQYLPRPTSTEWSAACKENTGDGHRAAMAIGAKVAQMDGAWWCSTIRAPDEPMPRLSIMEKSLPGCIVVGSDGKRFSNESQNYMAYLLDFFSKHNDGEACYPAWMIFDRRFRSAYIVGPLMSARVRPDWVLPKAYFDQGLLSKAKSIEALAEKIGVATSALNDTVSRFNEYAVQGRDREFKRGNELYDRYYGDESVKPNPCLAPILKSPFYALRIEPGDFGTHGGMVINKNAQVLDEENKPISGLYAAGNCAAAILPTYPGPGSTLGPAMTFAYLAGKHIATSAGAPDTERSENRSIRRSTVQPEEEHTVGAE